MPRERPGTVTTWSTADWSRERPRSKRAFSPAFRNARSRSTRTASATSVRLRSKSWLFLVMPGCLGKSVRLRSKSWLFLVMSGCLGKSVRLLVVSGDAGVWEGGAAGGFAPKS
jgi:hypothetical protein